MTRPFILSASIAEVAFAVPESAAPILCAAEAAGLDLLVMGRSGARPFDAQVLLAWAAPLTSRLASSPRFPRRTRTPSTLPGRFRPSIS
ncbi:hypothetical protein [Novosphingobium sp. ST904]|uniref:hypothetical protein n=1 Tax=Novosphingobium sp. ST904 TaxID=1684385 RepID=UPI0009EA0205|nr:hypothetical protein [Novosphingobium sp. ST904]